MGRGVTLERAAPGDIYLSYATGDGSVNFGIFSKTHREIMLI